MIDVEGMSKRFGATHAVSDLTFRVGAGEVVGLLGRNGAGKTTTMRVVTGFFPPSAGRVRIDGLDVFDDPIAVKRRVGYLPETPPLYADMIVAPFLRFCARLRGLTRAQVDEAVGRTLEQCGLTAVAGRLVGNLSRGYRQRVGLAQALVHDPAVLVLDEPTTALDPGQIREIRTLITDLARSAHRTIVLSTHRLEDVTATCDRVIVIAQGRLVADESLEEALASGSLEDRFLALTSEPRDSEPS